MVSVSASALVSRTGQPVRAATPPAGKAVGERPRGVGLVGGAADEQGGLGLDGAGLRDRDRRGEAVGAGEARDG